MKKYLLLTSLILGSCEAFAQQIPNGNFEGKWVTCYPYTGGYVNRAMNNQPTSWTVANVAGLKSGYFGMTGATNVGEEEKPGHGGSGSALKISNTPNSVAKSKIVPGYATLGTTWNTANSSGGNADGGTFGGISFTYKPDAVSFFYKRSIGDTNTQSSVVAYLWNGHSQQESVPVTTGGKTAVTMQDRDINILKKGNGSQGGNVTNNSKLIASLELYLTEKPSDWTEKIVEFTYNNEYSEETPEMFNIIFAASDYFNTSVTKDVSLSIDDVKLIYYSTLKTLTYGTGSNAQDLLAKAGKAVGNVVSIDASDLFYEKSKVAFKKRGQGANITEEKYDPATCILTIKVEANDISANDQNYTIYKVQFKKPITISDDQNVITTEDDNAKVIMTRTFKKGWNTICLPFSTTAEALGAAKVQKLTYCTNDLINFTSVEGNIMEWNTPYLIYFNEEKAFTSKNPFIFAGKVAASDQSTGVTFSPITMRGNYKAKFHMKGNYGVVDQNGVQRIMSGGEEATLGPCRAYFTGDGNHLANGMLISFDGQTTGITSAELNAEGAAEDAPIYNLQGVRVNHLTKGVYIKGGKKIIVK